MSNSFQISRRSFLARCTTVAATTGLPLWFVQRELAAAEAATKPVSANDRPGVALIGCGGMGRGDAAKASGFGSILAVQPLELADMRAGAEGADPQPR